MNLNFKNEYYRYRRYFLNLQKIPQSTKTRSFVWISLTLFTICFFSIVSIKPTLVTIARLDREIKDKKEANQKLQLKINSIIAAQEEFAKNFDNLSLLDEAIPKNNEFPTLAFFFETVASEQNVSVRAFNFEKIELRNKTVIQKSNTASFGFSISVHGDYLNLKKFLQDIENSRRMITIERSSFSLVKSEKGQDLSLQISGKANYYQPILTNK